METLDRYKQNLHTDGDKVISYTTHVATMDFANKKLYVHGYWSVTTSKHINYVASYYGLTKENKTAEDIEQPEDNSLKMVAMVAKMGDIFSDNQKDRNDWKARMLKAGLENKGLIMPDDWESLTEAEKEVRLNMAIEAIG
jgi:hypothetical protein